MKIRNVCGNPVNIGSRIVRIDEVADVVEDETVKSLLDARMFVTIDKIKKVI